MTAGWFTAHDPHRRALDYVLLGLVLLSVFIANLVIFLLFEGTVAVISSFFYIPVIFTAFQYPLRGIFTSATLGLVFLAVIYSLLKMTPVTVTTATVQFYVFVAVGTLVSRLSEELREQQIRYQGIFDHSQAGVMLVRRSNQRILEANRRCADLLESSPEGLAGRPLSSIWLDPEERDRFFRRLDDEGTVTDYETRCWQGRHRCGGSLSLPAGSPLISWSAPWWISAAGGDPRRRSSAATGNWAS